MVLEGYEEPKVLCSDCTLACDGVLMVFCLLPKASMPKQETLRETQFRKSAKKMQMFLFGYVLVNFIVWYLGHKLMKAWKHQPLVLRIHRRSVRYWKT